MTGIAIYVEGGGDTAHQKAELRQGFDAFLGELKAMARAKRMQWKLVCCGGRNQAFEAFMHAVRTEPGRWNVLLVDSEGPVGNGEESTRAIRHLRERDGWQFEEDASGDVNLMIQCMETWLVADAEALSDFYGQHFNANALPRRQNLEEEPKRAVLSALAAATRHTQKGEYAKIRHASKLLAKVDPRKTRARCAACDTFFSRTGLSLALD